MTQEALAERSGLSVDSIRRLERGGFSPSLDTLWKLCQGLELMLSTLFSGLEVGERDLTRELIDLVLGRSPGERELGFHVLWALFRQLDREREEDD